VSDHNLRKRLIRLAYDRPKIRAKVLPLLREARTTPQTDRFIEAVDALTKSVGDVMSWYRRRQMKPAQLDQAAKDTARDAKALLPWLDLRWQDEKKQQTIKKQMRRWANFKKMVEAFAKVKNGEELLTYVKSLDTKSKEAWEKYRDLRDWVVGLVRAFDVTIEGTIDVGPWTVRLMSHAREDWDRDKVKKLDWIIGEAVKTITRAGLGKALGGKMQAWPTDTVPLSGKGGRNTGASYNMRNDLTRLAVGEAAREVSQTLVHELGHRFYFKVLGSRGREAWHQFFGEHVGKPDLSRVMKLWESYAKEHEYGAWSPYFARHLKKVDPDQLMWLEIATRATGVAEEFDPYTGQPRRKKTNKPGLEVVKQALPKLEVFLHPVTAYSTTHPDELFAETFSHIVMNGPRSVPPIVRYAFKQAVPQARIASSSNPV